MADLARFLTAQAPLYQTVLDELRDGRKRTHWMWFVFPQLAGLGRSQTARFYAIADLDEAQHYARHPLLGARLVECTAIVNGLEGQSARGIFGTPDDLKFRSSMTLFMQAEPDQPIFRTAIDRYFGGEPDRLTLDLLARPNGGAG